MHKNKNKKRKTETSLAIYLINGAVAFLIAVVVYFNGPQFTTILGFFALLVISGFFYNYKVCIFTAISSVISYGLVISYLTHKDLLHLHLLDLLVPLAYFLIATFVITWLVLKIQTRNAFESGLGGDQMNLILNSFPEGVIILDKKDRIIFLNKQAEKILGVKASKLIDVKLSFPSTPAYKNLHKILTLSQEAWDFSTTELKVIRPQNMTLQVTTTRIRNQKDVLFTIKIIRDVTHERAVDKMKSELISIVSHQLRTPLSAVKWSIKMLIDGDVGKITEEQRNILAKGYRSNERMIHLVNDLLNISRIEEGRFQYQFTTASLEDLVTRTINEFKYSLEEKDMTLTFEKPPKSLPKIRMDPSKIHVVLQNILSNAVNYTPSGGQIKVSVKSLKSSVQVAIKDDGMGIPKKQQHRLFSKFFRADNAVRMQTEGSGLGLFIAKNIVEKHKGRIWAESEENKGSTFYFTLPLT